MGRELEQETIDGLREENAALRKRLDEAEEMMDAISGGEVDAFLVRDGGDEQVLVLDGADRPYRLILERMHQGAVTLTADGSIAYANDRFRELLGLERGVQIGLSFLSHVVDASLPSYHSLIERARSGGGEAELELRRGDGSVFPALVTAARLFRRTEIICLIVTDLSAQKADRKKDEFLAVLAHEIRNYLAPMRNGLQVLNLIGSKGEDVARIRDMMEHQMENLVRIVDDLLDVNRVTQGKLELRKERMELGPVVLRAVESSRHTIEELRHQLDIDLPSEPLALQADPLRLSQILTNLLNNAAKYTPAGGKIQVSVRRAPERPERAAIRVSDTGMGIRPDMLSRVFDLFAQGEAGSARSGGLGIGLTLAKRLTELHGGTLEVASEGPGRGSSFTVELPLLHETEADASRQGSSLS
jgi:PAS domain S-box-containing protein